MIAYLGKADNLPETTVALGPLLEIVVKKEGSLLEGSLCFGPSGFFCRTGCFFVSALASGSAAAAATGTTASTTHVLASPRLVSYFSKVFNQASTQPVTG